MAEPLRQSEDAFGSNEAFAFVSGGDVDDPYPDFVEKRRSSPVEQLPVTPVQVHTDVPIFTCYRYEDIDRILRDPETFSSTTYSAVMGPVFGRTILEMDPPEHTEQRGLVNWAFRKRGLSKWESGLIEPTAAAVIDRFAGAGRAEMMRSFCVPFPVQVIAGILGLPPEDYPQFLRWSIDLISWAGDYDSGMAASQALAAYFGGILDERRGDPREDLISDLAIAEIDGVRLTDEQIFGFLRLLITAGSETTGRSLGNLLVGLLSNPDQLEAVRGDRSLVRVAIEEAVRWEPPLLFIQRKVTRDVELSGVAVPNRSVVSLSIGSANRDEAKFGEDADRYDISRGITQHLSFASGPHMCLGQQLARTEMEVSLNMLLNRLPNLRFDPDEPEPKIRGQVFRSPAELPIIWD